jgi:hypothetical protein
MDETNILEGRCKLKIIELARWESSGIGRVEKYLQDTVGQGEIGLINGAIVEELLTSRGLNIKSRDPLKNYYVYYNFHPTYGYKTTFDITNQGIRYKVEKPNGFSLQAFMSEIVILDIQYEDEM